MTFQTRKTHAGFTLIESMMTLGAAAILCAVSLPALGGLVHGTQSRVAREAMFTSLNLARNTAVTRQQEIVLCASSDGARCDGDMWWHDGWILFQDTNRDGKRDLDEPLIEVAQGQHDVTIATSTDRTRIIYHSDGSTPGTNTTFAFCDAKRAHSTGTIVLSNSGRARQGNATAEQDAVCAQSHPNA